jgi:hypothetical protein
VFKQQGDRDYAWQSFIITNVIPWNGISSFQSNFIRGQQAACPGYSRPCLTLSYDGISRGMRERGKGLLKNLRFQVEDHPYGGWKINFPISTLGNTIVEDLCDDVEEMKNDIEEMKSDAKTIARDGYDTKRVAEEAGTGVLKLQEDMNSLSLHPTR